MFIAEVAAPEFLIPARGAVLAIDVGWSENRRSSAACLLTWTEHGIEVQLCRFTAQPRNVRDSVAKLVAGHSCLAAAIDGPLARGFEEIGRYRTAERMLTRAFRTTIGKPGQSNSPNGILLNRVANQAALALGQLGPVEIQGFVRRPVVVGVLDGTVRTDGRPVGENGTALPGQA